jgi:hypothetical protein
MFKMGLLIHLDTSNTSYGQKKGRKSNWQFESWPLKVGNWFNFLACRWFATCHWKAFNESYNFVSDLIPIGGLHTKLWGPKIEGVPTLGISRFPFGSPETKCHLDVGLMERHKIYYEGEGGGLPKSGPWWVLWVRVYTWFVLTPNMPQLCISQLVVWFVQARVSNWCLSLFLIPIPELQHALYPQSATSQGACPNSLLFCCFHLRLTFESIKEIGSASLHF